MKHFFIVLVYLCFLSCNRDIPTTFSEQALNETFISMEGGEINFEAILDSYNNKTIFIDVWASWCGDCIKALPKVATLQKEYPEVVFLFLSIDKSENNWKKGIDRHNIDGEHYYMPSGWNGAFGDFIDLDWTPRYIILDQNKNIKLFEAIKADDKRIKEKLQ